MRFKSKLFLKSYTIPDEEFVKEHKKLVPILRDGDREQQLEEADEQEQELKTFLSR